MKLDHVYTSAGLVAKYVVRKYPGVRKVFAIGEKTLRESLEAEGIEVVGADQHIFPPESPMTMWQFESYQVDPDIGAVVYGLDFSFTISKLMLASLYLQELKVPLIVTNDDRGTMVKGRLYPGAGSALASITTACKLRKGSKLDSTSIEEPGTFDLIGKPNPFAVNLVKEEHNLPAQSKSLMVGDRPNTDI